MTREIIERLVDDLDGGAAVETVEFGLDGASYEIDLSKKNATALRKALEHYVAGARRTKAASATKRSSAKKATGGGSKRGYDVAALREWAASNDVRVPSRGRIPHAIVADYQAAGGR